ncbi:MAG TPA: PA0069 family radical SAM protein [Ideonella sp.]|uniref:PA0069 family radical SAM protein n=1 Tax=Ideonella sp. TaxID=1929293 RepID=UPI002E36F8D9|nr:PA0069 family radical SAM protein [Ideonella sp.]HEX5683669.1 PA0069 family radical SAM protein [Ideonella sp.]
MPSTSPPRPPAPPRPASPAAGTPILFVPARKALGEPVAIKGRGTAWAIEHRFTRDHHESFDDGWGTLDQDAAEEKLPIGTEVIEQRVKSILTGNDSPDINFDLSINPYRGCEHGCIYCFARPTHSYFNLSPGLDFETKIFAKVNAAERLRATLQSPSYEPMLLNIGSATDAYQPAERKLGITRSVIEVLSEFKHPFSVITKSSGIERDIDLIAPMAAGRMAAAYVSLTTLDGNLARILEPRAAQPERRLRTIERLSKAGIPVGVSASPMIPFINEPELERILEAAAQAGATRAFSIVIRLPWEVNPLFQQWLEAHFPDRAKRVMARIRDMRGGKDYDAKFGSRMTGQGLWAELIRQRFNKAAARLGLLNDRTELDMTRFVRQPKAKAKSTAQPAEPPVQQSLF